ncbi:MAG TPA: squalene synthase HpnC [Vicinamibacterales bacterium]|nr:squalene synthase HpnC [Vicinamibacterales bacterium]
MRLEQSYAVCLRLARDHYENFPVASWLLPARMRPHVAAVYAFARTADDFADEDGLHPAERERRLDEWLARLHGTLAARETVMPSSDADHVFAALAHTIRACDLPVGLFEDLVSAFRQDVTVRRYRTWDDVLDYCRRSANPVGRLVLRIGGWRNAEADAASDAVCTALQLTNFWQDFALDWRRGRLYLPEAERDAAGADEADLDAGRMTPAWRTAIARAVARTRELFRRGRSVADAVDGRLRCELRATWLGGMRILERIEAAGFDVLGNRPTLGLRDAPLIAWRLAAWRRAASPIGRGAPIL